jgi:hypothetical protein
MAVTIIMTQSIQERGLPNIDIRHLDITNQ